MIIVARKTQAKNMNKQVKMKKVISQMWQFDDLYIYEKIIVYIL
jgi:hypothetical protein